MQFKPVHNEPSVYGLSWFVSPRPALVWIGQSGRPYPHSIELWPVCTNPSKKAGINFGLLKEGRQMMNYFALNQHYYKLDISLKWSEQT